jgi:hypothetical protein
MSKFYDKKVILQKIETTEGTDAAPVVGTDAILTRNYRPTVLDTDRKERNIETQYFGAKPAIMSGFRRGADFEIEIAGSGSTATTVPAWMKVNRIAGFDAGVAGGSNVVQTPISSSIPSATHWAFIDNLQLQAVGCRASMGIRFADDEIPFFTYTVRGRAPTALAAEVTPGAPTVSAFANPVIASTENTTFLLDTYALPLRSLELDSNNDLVFRSLIGPQDRMIWRNRSWGGRILGELPDLSSKDYFAKVRPGTTMALSLIHGTTAGNIVSIAAPKVQIVGVDTPEEDGQVMLSLDVILLPNAGNDEIAFTSS